MSILLTTLEIHILENSLRTIEIQRKPRFYGDFFTNYHHFSTLSTEKKFEMIVQSLFFIPFQLFQSKFNHFLRPAEFQRKQCCFIAKKKKQLPYQQPKKKHLSIYVLPDENASL